MISEEMTPEELQKIWREQQEKLSRAELLNQKVIGDVTRENARSIAPFSTALVVVLSIALAFGLAYSIVADPMYYPVPLLCVAGLVMQVLKIKMRKSLSDMGNSVIDRELNVLHCRRNFRIMWIVSFVLFVPYIIWFDWWMKGIVDNHVRIILLSLTIVGAAAMFIVSFVRVSQALREIERYTAYLKDFD